MDSSTPTTLVPLSPNLHALLCPLGYKQKKYILHKILGATDEEAKRLSGAALRTVQLWRQKDKVFVATYKYVSEDMPLEVRKDALMLLLSKYTPGVIEDIGKMALMPWKNCHDPIEFKMKWQCMELVLKAAGLGGDTTIVKNMTYEKIMMNIMTQPDNPQVERIAKSEAVEGEVVSEQS